MHETFWTLLRDAAHWEFEIFLTILTEAATAGLGWLIVLKHWRHHIARDQRDTVYNWSMNPQAKAAGHTETPEGICDDCGGAKAPLDGVDLCTGCGDIKVQKSERKPFDEPGWFSRR